MKSLLARARVATIALMALQLFVSTAGAQKLVQYVPVQQILIPTQDLTLKPVDSCRTFGTTHAGDLTINSPADVPSWLRTVQGNLTVNAAFAATIHLPCLQQVTGNLRVSLAAGNNSGALAQSVVTAPRLTTVGGDLSMSMTKPYGMSHVESMYDLGLNSITQVNGDVSILASINCANLSGLSGLTALGQVTLTAEGYLYSAGPSQFLRNVTHVDTLITKGMVFRPLPGLLSAGEVAIQDRSPEATPYAYWTDIPIGALYLVNVSDSGAMLSNYFEMVPGAELVVFPGVYPTNAELCAFINDEQGQGWSPVVVGFDPTGC